MNAEDYQKVKEIFNSVLEIGPEGRGAFLDERCDGDGDLRKEVERLLASYDSEYLERPAVGNLSEKFVGDALAAGQQIGHYSIVEKIGSGGMGEVYLAEDGKLGRRVAIKLLPETFTEDEDRLRRFEQEARTASALNHPNILTVFEIGETGSTRYIATEYIDGETLRSKLNRGKLPVGEALDIAVQCASALAAAHESGIIHRDIKPENIMLRRDNLVKVLDFGLAKLLVQPAATGSVSQEAPTERHFNTAPGMIMGTVQYMSPEQARGHPTDARTDIWSLGVVIYEMVAGQPPFAGENTADLIAEIVKTYPAPVSHTTEGIPERLDEIVAKTLEKNPDERYQTAKDLLIDLKRLKRKLDLDAEIERSHSPATSGGRSSLDSTEEANTAAIALKTADAENGSRNTVSSAEYIVSAISRHKSRFAAFSVVTIMVLSSVGFALWYFGIFTSKAPGRPFDSFELIRITNSGKAVSPTLSQDGKFVAFFNSDNDEHSLVIRQIATNTDVKVTNPKKSDVIPTLRFSNDGAFLYFAMSDEMSGTLFRVPSFGGTPVKVIDDIFTNITFSPDGARFAFIRFGKDVSTIMIANYDGSGLETFLALDGEFSVTDIAWSPDGTVFAITKGEPTRNASIFTVSLADKTLTRVGEGDWINPGSLSWTRDGSRLLFISKASKQTPNQLWSLDYPSGKAKILTSDSNNYASLSSVSNSGTMVVERFDFRTSIWSQDLRTNATKQLTPERVDRIGLDGIEENLKGELLITKREGGWGNFWLLNANDFKTETRLTDEVAEHKSPAISSDGRFIVFNSNKAIWRIDSDGQNAVQLSHPGEKSDSNPVLLGDGRSILFERTTERFESKIMKTSIDGEEPREAFSSPHTGYSGVAFSPEQNILAVGVNSVPDGTLSGGKSSIQFFRVEGENSIPIERKVVTSNLGSPVEECKWTRQGKLICSSWKDQANLFVESGTGTFEKLTQFDDGIVSRFALSRDGTKIFIVRGYRTYDIFLVKDTGAGVQ